MTVWRCRWCGRRLFGWFHKPAKCDQRLERDLHDVCITKDSRNLHDEGYCDVTGQDDNEWRG